MTKSVLESMARAIGEELYAYVDPNDTPNTWASSKGAARAALIALRDGVDPESPVTAQIVRAYVDGVLGEEKVSEGG